MFLAASSPQFQSDASNPQPFFHEHLVASALHAHNALVNKTKSLKIGHTVDYIIWMDSEKAQVFGLNTKGIEKSNLKKSGGSHHSGDSDNINDEQLKHFYHDLSSKVSDAEQLLIMGPGASKTHFKTYLDDHAAGLSKNVVGVENSDHPSDNQILEASKDFFKTYQHFNTEVTAAQ